MNEKAPAHWGAVAQKTNNIFGGVQTTNVPTAKFFLSPIYILPFRPEYLREYQGLENPLPMSLLGTTIREA